MKKGKTIAEILLILLFAVSLFLFWLGPILGGKELSETENRALTAFPDLTLQGFTEKTFQDDLENALGDRLLGSEEIRSAVRDGEAAILEWEQALLYRLNPRLKDGYVQIAEGYYAYDGDEHRIVEKPLAYSQPAEELAAFAREINGLPGVRKYLYFIENSRSVNFDRPEENGKAYEWVCSFFRLDGRAEFAVPDYETYCRYFYQTDHHWNHLGSYRGYTEIVSMLKPGDPPVAPAGETETTVVFNGSYARQTKSLRATEHFAVYDFALDRHAVTINGKRGTYGRLNAYIKGKYNDADLTNHYANCYGGEYGEIVYDFGDHGRGTLLLISSSYSNPINALIASHFDQTYVIDLRYYEEYAGHPFRPAPYAAEHGVDTVLLLGDIQMFDEIGKGGDH